MSEFTGLQSWVSGPVSVSRGLRGCPDGWTAVSALSKRDTALSGTI